MRFYSLEKLINLHDGYRRSFKIDQHSLMLLQLDGELLVVEGHCPHRGHPLIDAHITGRQLACPLHDYQFDLSSGATLRMTKEPCRKLVIFDVIYQDKEVGVII